MRNRVSLVQNAAVAAFVAVAASCSTPPSSPSTSPSTSPSPSGAWELLPAPVPTNASLRGLGVVDERTVWVGGAGGALWRTDDGGRTWSHVAPPDCAACDFRDVEAFGPSRAIVMVAGEPARLYGTADGGRTWEIVHADARPGAFFDAIAIGSKTLNPLGPVGDAPGMLFGDPQDGAFCVWISRDAGASWDAVPPAVLPPPLAGEAAFAASGTCVAVTCVRREGRLWIATGGGERARVLIGEWPGAAWRAVDVPIACGAPSRGGFSLAFVPDDDQRVVLVGGDYAMPAANDGTAAWSDDGGAVWRAAVGGAGGYRSAVVWLSGLSFLAVGPGGTSRSDDAGRTWQVVANDGFHALARGRDGSVFACGSDGRVARWVSRR